MQMHKGVSSILKVVGVVSLVGLGIACYCFIRKRTSAKVDKISKEYAEVCAEIKRLESFDCGNEDDVSEEEIERIGVIADRLADLRKRKSQLEKEFLGLNVW